MDQLQTFINKLNGQQGVGNTPENLGECVGLAMKWLVATLNKPQVWGNAQDLLKNADRTFYDVILNTPTGVPPRGAVIVFNKGFNGTVGHTGIVTRADVNTFELFEQNNPLGQGCRLHTYNNYNYVDGWIVAKTITASPPPSTGPMATISQADLDQLKREHDSNYDNWQAALHKLSDAEGQVNTLTIKINKVKLDLA